MAQRGWLRIDMSRDQAEKYLRSKPVGTFVIRNSSHYGHFALTVRMPESAVKPVHSVVIQSNMMPSGSTYSLQKSRIAPFQSFEKLVEHYSNNLSDAKQLGVILQSEYTVDMVRATAAHVGARVRVKGYPGEGTMLFYGNHKETKKPRIGVRLDRPQGKNNGTVGGHKYFRCDADHGVLVVPKKVTLVDADEAGQMAGQRAQTRRHSIAAGYLVDPTTRDSRKGSTAKKPMRRQGSASGTALPALPGSAAGPGPRASLDNEPWFVGAVPGDSVRIKLAQGRDGDYVVRQSTTANNQYLIVFNRNGTIHEQKCQFFSGSYRFTQGDNRSPFQSMNALVMSVDACRRPAKHLCRDLVRVGGSGRGGGAVPPPGATRGPAEIPLDDTDFFVGTHSKSRIEAFLSEGEQGDYVVWETNQGGYTLSVLENGSSCAHYSITKLGTEFRLDATFTVYPSIPAIISATPAARTSAKALVVDDWVPSSASAAATLLAGSSGASEDIYDDGDDEQFGGFGGDGGFGGSDLPAEETDQLYMNSDVSPLPAEESEQEYMNQDVVDNIAHGHAAGHSGSAPPPIASRGDLPPEDLEQEYVNQDAVDNVLWGNSAAAPPRATAEPPLVPSRGGGAELPAEETGEMYMNDDAVQSVVANAASAFEPNQGYLAISPDTEADQDEAEDDFSGFGDVHPVALPSETVDTVDGDAEDADMGALPAEAVGGGDAWDEEETYDTMDSHAPDTTAPPSRGGANNQEPDTGSISSTE